MIKMNSLLFPENLQNHFPLKRWDNPTRLLKILQPLTVKDSLNTLLTEIEIIPQMTKSRGLSHLQRNVKPAQF